MTLRMRIADWLSGGAITTAKDMLSHNNEITSRYRKKAVALERALEDTRRVVDRQDQRILALESALTLIADQETEKANATVKRMVRIAKGARAGRPLPGSIPQTQLSFKEINGRMKGMPA